MKIKSGGPKKTRGAKKAKETSSAAAAKFRALVEVEETDVDDGGHSHSHSQSALLDELLALADELQQGDTTDKEASRRFAGLVVKERFQDPAASAGGKKMVDTISDMVENDPNFVSELAASLKKLSKK